MDTIHASFQITIGKETRWVECRSWDDGSSFKTLECVALARVGRMGSKLWPVAVTVFRQKDGSYRPSMHAVRLNRTGQIVDWNREESARHLSQHNSAHWNF